jgi:carbamoyl-phosphate synthase/aspartate carbamoyltransferase
MMNKRVVGNGSANGNGESKRKRRQITAKSATACFDMSKFKPGKLVFEDGDAFEGYSFGANLPKSGEIVFNTGMVGYPEALTDPSYRKQILILTYPLVGNYGVPGDEKDDIGLPAHFESNNIHVSGLIVSDYSQVHSHWNATRSLSEWLKEHNVPALFGLDTRRLTKKIREKGSMLGKIVFEDGDCEIKDPNKENLVAEVSLKEPKVYGKNGDKTIIAFDCGIKFNIIRYLVNHGVNVHVVPYDYDLKSNPSNITYDGIFISNGPGDPTMAEKCVESIRWAIDGQDKPIFGICLGNQILALAAGAKTYKMKYGNRSMNQPCVDLRTGRCYITPQNHGYAVDSDSLPEGWNTLFINANDMSNEGITHAYKKIFSVQFHPEACGGPTDTAFLFETFLKNVRHSVDNVQLIDPLMYNRPQVSKILLLGSGGLSIGQAGEFDYSGSQAIKALKEEGKEVILINPNIATVQTSMGMADKVYFQPVTMEMCVKIIEKERPDSIILSMGGQTALNVGVELHEAGVLKKYNVQVLGTPIPAIMATEDREEFAKRLQTVGESAALSYSATNVKQAVDAANKIGYPVLVRAAFALGGLGSGFADNEKELIDLANKAFAASPQILVDQDLRGWKEVEYEVVRDCRDNCITVCNMENFDPLGIHTGDSIVVAPSQTLSNQEYFKLRQAAIKVVRHLGVIGECNIQYALHPESERYCVIEVNARLSRSSALASKATGYPLAYVAAKLALGVDLVTLRNSVTKTTTACFEPSLDYCVVKIPRFDLKKFNRVSNSVGSSMKSVGEVMAIGRSFEETFQKAMRMTSPSIAGFESIPRLREISDAELDNQLKNPDYERVFAVAEAMERGYTVDRVHQLTKIDRWFLSKLMNVDELKRALVASKDINSFSRPQILSLKQHGFSDVQIARRCNTSELIVRRKRLSMDVKPCVKQIDTLAAEYPAQTNYLYMTYSGSEDDIEFDAQGIMVLGCGPYCIGSSVEFDWCAVSCVRQLRKSGFKAIVVNYNPETVSTDYDESDRLYFEELSCERVLDIYEREVSQGVIVSVGGQIANNLALPLHRQGVNILGTAPDMIDMAEDRHKFSALLDRLGVDQPKWIEFSGSSKEKMKSACDKMGYPVLVRPSFVLSGAAMRVASSWTELSNFLEQVSATALEGPIVVSKFILNAKEVEFDGVAKNGEILNYAISEHIENAGVHSGDATLILPAQGLYVETIRQIKAISAKIAQGLHISGPFNIQYMARDNFVKVIECNLRSSRTFPFASKTFNVNLISLATRVMAGLPAKRLQFNLLDLDYVGIKAPQFSFTRLQGADPTLGVEMSSTGEVACFGSNRYEAYLLALLSTKFKLPSKSRNVFLSLGPQKAKEAFRECASILQGLNYNLFGTTGTAEYLRSHGVEITTLHKPSSKSKPNSIQYLSDGKIELVINIPDGFRTETVSDGYLIRRTAVDFGVGLITNIKCGVMLVKALQWRSTNADTPPMHIQEYYRSNSFATF